MYVSSFTWGKFKFSMALYNIKFIYLFKLSNMYDDQLVCKVVASLLKGKKMGAADIKSYTLFCSYFEYSLNVS